MCFLFLSVFAWIIDVKGYRRIAFPLVVVGMNSIAAYVLPDLFEDFIQSSFRINLGSSFLNIFGPVLEPLFLGALTLITYWLVLFWMYRRKLFLRI
jgi:predicted acyltransferase